MNVLSLCDGLSCARLALEKCGITVDKYFAAEIKDIAIKHTQKHYPDTIQLGDVNKIRYENGKLIWFEREREREREREQAVQIDLVCFGSPCESVSRCMKEPYKLGLEDKVRSGLFFECNRIMKEVNPKYFLMENVIMKKEDENTISELMGVKPVRINSSLVSGQLRDRLYWTNIPNVTIPENKNIKLQDVLKEGYAPFEKARCLTKCESHGYFNGCFWTPSKRIHRTFFKAFGTMIFPSKEDYEKAMDYAKSILNGRPSRAEYFDNCDETLFSKARYLWKEERARLQTVPEEFVADLSEKEAADLLGDGWTVDVIAHIFKNIK